MNKKIFYLLLFLLPLGQGLCAQQPPTIKKSDKIEVIDGKKYFIHSVEKGQTLYSIAKTYSTTVDIILANNQEAVDGIRFGDKLKVPYSGNTEAVKKEIEKQSTTTQTTSTPKTATAKTTRPADSTATHKPRPATDLKNTATASMPIPKKDSVVSNPENVKPIGDIHVATFLPLDLSTVEIIDIEKIVHGDEKIPEDTRIGIEFYEGMKIAFDSLKKQGFQGFLHIYDSDVDSASFAKLLRKPELKEMDLIIGPLYGKRFDLVLKFAKENKINIVSPTLMGNHMLLGNPNTSKITPSYITQTEELAKYVAEKYATQNILIFNSTNPKDKPYLNTFKRTANPILQNEKADTVKEATFATLKNFISKTKPNIIIIPSTNQSFVTEAINKLYLHKQENKDSLIVLGLSNFQDIESLDFGYLKTLNAIVSSHTFIDYGNNETKKFILKYRNEFKTDPSSYAFAGFDAGYYYLSGLQKHGNAFQQKLPEIKYKGLQSEFNFFQSDPNSGYENRGVGIMKFENYSYVRVK